MKPKESDSRVEDRVVQYSSSISSSLFLSLLLSKSVNLPGWFESVLSSRTLCMCVYLVCIGEQSHGLCQFSLHWENMLLDRWKKGGAVKQTQGQQIQDPFFVKSTTTNRPDWGTSASKLCCCFSRPAISISTQRLLPYWSVFQWNIGFLSARAKHCGTVFVWGKGSATFTSSVYLIPVYRSNEIHHSYLCLAE